MAPTLETLTTLAVAAAAAATAAQVVRDGRARARAPKPKILTWQEALLIAAADARTAGDDMQIRRPNGRRSW